MAMSNDPCACMAGEYPVDVQRARRAFARAVKQLTKAKTLLGPGLIAYEAASAAYEERIYTNKVRIHERSGGDHWTHPSRTRHYVLNYRPWEATTSATLNSELRKYQGLKDLADRVTALTLKRDEIASMCSAEKHDFVAEWTSRADALTSVPELPPLEPEAPPKTGVAAWADANGFKVTTTKRPSIWDAIWGRS